MRRAVSKRAALAVALLALIATIVFSSVALAGVSTPRERATGKVHQMDRDANKIFDKLEKEMNKVGPDDELPVIAVFTKPTGPDKLSKLGDFTVNQSYDNFPFLAMNLKPGQIKALAKMSGVVQVEYDEPVSVCLDTATQWFGVDKAGLDFGVTGDRNGNETSYTKDDIVIAVIDTGIDPNHVDLDGGKIIGWKDYVGSQGTPYDDHGHGTHCSSIAAGTGEGNPAYKGVAPGAALVGVKVLNSAGSGSLSTITSAVDWCITNKATYGIEVISLSLGSTGSSDGTDSLSQAVNRAYTNGIVPVVAAGNSGPAKQTVGSPAAAANAVTVGAMTDVGEKGFSQAYFSSRGPTLDGRIKPDVSSPGVNIMAADSGTTNQYISYSGTSMATPFTSGTVALMLDANPSLTPAQVKSLLESTAIDWGPVGKDIDYGSGRLDGYEAIRQAGSFSGTGPDVPNHQLFSGTISTSGGEVNHEIEVTTTAYPIALTLIMTNWTGSSNPNFNLYLYSPSGSQVASGTTTTRQETINYTPTVTGTYRVNVRSSSGTGPYTLDVSAGLGEAPPPVDDPPTVSIADPDEGETVAGTYAVKVQASDDIGISLVEVQIDDGPWNDITSTLSGGYYTYSWDTTAYADGAHTVTAQATDTIDQTATHSHGCTVNNAEPPPPPPGGAHTLTFTGTVTSAARDQTYYFNVDSTGYVYLTLNWNTTADLDFYVYGPTGSQLGRAYTTSKPETLRVFTETPGTGEYSVRVNLYSGADSNFTLTVDGYEAKTWTGTVNLLSPDAWHDVQFDYTGSSLFKLSWTGTFFDDLDMYIYDPNGNLDGQAAGILNPEQVYVNTDQTGIWQVNVNLYFGFTDDYVLKVYVPEDNLSQ